MGIVRAHAVTLPEAINDRNQHLHTIINWLIAESDDTYI